MQAIVDDYGPKNLIQYNGPWVLDGQAADYNKTAHGTCQGGSEFRFKFNGTSINVYGKLSAGYQTSSLYEVDGQRRSIYTTPNISSAVHQTLLYSTDGLKPGQHTLSAILINSTSSDSSAPCFWFDFLMYTPTPRNGGKGNNDQGGNAGSMGSSKTMMEDPHDARPPSGHGQAVSADSEHPSNHSNIATVFGIIIATLVALLACVAAFLLWKRHRKMQRRLAALRNGGLEGGYNERTSFVVLQGSEAPPTFPSTAIFSTYYEPSYAPYSPTESDKTSLLPRQLTPARRPTKLSRGLSMLSRFSSTKKRTPSSKAPSDLVFAPPNSDPSANQSRVVIAAEKRGPMEFDGT